MLFSGNADHISSETRMIYTSPESDWPRMLPTLKQIDPREKIRTIRMVRFSDPTCGLKEAKDFVEREDVTEEMILSVIHAVPTADQLRIRELESQLATVNRNLMTVQASNMQLIRDIERQRARIDELHTDYQAELRGERNRFNALLDKLPREELERIVRNLIAAEMEALP